MPAGKEKRSVMKGDRLADFAKKLALLAFTERFPLRSTSTSLPISHPIYINTLLRQDRTLLQILDRLTRIEARLPPERDEGSRPPSGNAPPTPLQGDNIQLSQAMPDMTNPR